MSWEETSLPSAVQPLHLTSWEFSSVNYTPLSHLFTSSLFADSSLPTYRLAHILATQLYLVIPGPVSISGHLLHLTVFSLTRENLDSSIHPKCYIFIFFSSFLNHCNLGSYVFMQNYKYSSFHLPMYICFKACEPPNQKTKSQFYYLVWKLNWR